MYNPTEGMTSENIRCMSGDDPLDMDYFLNEDDPFGNDFSEEGFYIFWISYRLVIMHWQKFTKRIFDKFLLILYPSNIGIS